MTAVIIAGGKGTRLKNYTETIPKPMIPVCGMPILAYQIEEFKRYGITDIIITVGYLKDAIIQYFGDGSRFGVTIRYVEEQQPLGTAGAFYYLKEMVSEEIFVVYGDVLFSLSLERMLQFHRSQGSEVSIAVHPNSHPYDSDVVLYDKDYKVIGFLRKNEDRTGIYYRNCVNAGFMILNKNALEFFSIPEKCDLEKDFLQAFIMKRQVSAYQTSEYMKDMGTYDRLQQVEDAAKNGIIKERNLDRLQKCVFLDRDGTINIWKGLLNDPNLLELEAEAADAIRKINESGYLVIVITNQPVIARGLCTIEELDEIHKRLETLLGKQGAYLDTLYYCPHHPDKGYPEERKEYKIKCDCRKPEIGMIKRAEKEFHIDLEKSWMIGDTTVDIQVGKNAGLKTILLQTGEGGKDHKYQVIPDQVCKNLKAAVDYILK